MTNNKTQKLDKSYLEAMGLPLSEEDYLDERMLETIVFLTDIGMEIVSCRLSSCANQTHTHGHIAFVYDPYIKNIFDLVEVPLTEVDANDEYLLLYRFVNDREMMEDIQRIEKLFRKYQ